MSQLLAAFISTMLYTETRSFVYTSSLYMSTQDPLFNISQFSDTPDTIDQTENNTVLTVSICPTVLTSVCHWPDAVCHTFRSHIEKPRRRSE